MTPLEENQLNSYRLTNPKEPTDWMLEEITKEAAADAKIEWEAVRKAYFDEIKEEIQKVCR